jgi:hypothetical protein
MLFADTVHEEFNSSASRTRVDIETIAFHKQLANLTQNSPIRSFVETSRSEVLEFLITARACHRVDETLGIFSRRRVRMWAPWFVRCHIALVFRTAERRVFHAIF